MLFISYLLLFLISVISCEPKSAVKFYVTNDSLNDACMLLTISAEFNVQYKVSKKPYNVMGYLNQTQFKNAVVQADGSCLLSSNVMQISWPAVHNSTNWNMSIRIEHTNAISFKIMNTNLMIEADSNFPGITNLVTWNLTGEIVTKEFTLKDYFICTKPVTLNFNENDTKVVVKILYVQFQGFRSKSNNGDYTGSKDECVIDVLEKQIVPLIVGGVLTGMIIIVIITYLIGRHRHRANYQTI